MNDPKAVEVSPGLFKATESHSIFACPKWVRSLPKRVRPQYHAFVTFALLQAVNFLLLTVNYRAVAHVQYIWAALTDGAICLLSWTLLRKIASAEGWPSRIGYACGGMVGSFLGIWVTRIWG